MTFGLDLFTTIEKVLAQFHSVWKASFGFQDFNHAVDTIQRASMFPTEAFHTPISCLDEPFFCLFQLVLREVEGSKVVQRVQGVCG